MIVRKDEMRASKAMQHRVENTPNIEVLWNTTTKEITGDKTVNGVVIVNTKTNVEKKLDVQGFFDKAHGSDKGE